MVVKLVVNGFVRCCYYCHWSCFWTSDCQFISLKPYHQSLPAFWSLDQLSGIVKLLPAASSKACLRDFSSDITWNWSATDLILNFSSCSSTSGNTSWQIEITLDPKLFGLFFDRLSKIPLKVRLHEPLELSRAELKLVCFYINLVQFCSTHFN